MLVIDHEGFPGDREGTFTGPAYQARLCLRDPYVEVNGLSDESHYRALERMYLAAPCNDYYDPDITIRDGWAEVVVPVRRKQYHPGGAVHGTSYFKALDDSAYFAAHSHVQDAFLLTTEFTLELKRPVSNGVLRGEGEVVDPAGEIITAESVVYDSENRVVARGTGSFKRGDTELTEEVGYKRG